MVEDLAWQAETDEWWSTQLSFRHSQKTLPPTREGTDVEDLIAWLATDSTPEWPILRQAPTTRRRLEQLPRGRTPEQIAVDAAGGGTGGKPPTRPRKINWPSSTPTTSMARPLTSAKYWPGQAQMVDTTQKPPQARSGPRPPRDRLRPPRPMGAIRREPPSAQPHLEPAGEPGRHPSSGRRSATAQQFSRCHTQGT
ncbi:unnamed protein product [Trichogramma brassicae]|uniref:Uncharacterized protein n=1 Tax=Trichogramma brassicae TaxID=86971 RepID=A0A6H5IPK5_9HYME|nr:unnamed protein product [Trichogramma brassicae]